MNYKVIILIITLLFITLLSGFMISCNRDSEVVDNEIQYREKIDGPTGKIETFPVIKGYAVLKNTTINGDEISYLDIELYNKDVEFDQDLCSSKNAMSLDAQVIKISLHSDDKDFKGVYTEESESSKWFDTYLFVNKVIPDGGNYYMNIKEIEADNNGNPEDGEEITAEVQIELNDGTVLKGSFEAEICVPEYKD